MDMNDILNQWDKIQADARQKQKENSKSQTGKKNVNAPSGTKKSVYKENTVEEELRTQNEKTVNPMELWLRRYGVVDKDKIAEDTNQNSRQNDRSYILKMRPEATIDLHGLHQDEAEIRLDSFIAECKQRGLKKVLIIHGKGIHTSGTDPVLGELVRKFIERDKRCGTSGHPKSNADGGTGATWVILK